jgi:transcriptional regulator with XRE-family HTH domain
MKVTIQSMERVIMKDIEKQINYFVGEKIRAAREVVGVSQQVVAKELNITFQQVQKYEKGFNRISAVKIFMLSQAFNVPLSYFFPKTDGEPNQEGIPPRTLRVIKMLNKFPEEHFNDLTDVVGSVLKIASDKKTKGK